MNEPIVKNWVTVPRANVDKALKWAKKRHQYITNDYAVIGGRIFPYQKGNDEDNFDFFWVVSEPMREFERLFGVNSDRKEIKSKLGYSRVGLGNV